MSSLVEAAPEQSPAVALCADDRLAHLWILLSYVALCVVLYGSYQHLHSKDEVNYLVIAERFARGEWRDAVNAYWHAGLPLLLAPLLATGLPPVPGAKLLCLLIGVFAFLGVRALSYRFAMSVWARRLVLIALVPILVHHTAAFFTPDVLLTGALAWYFSVIFDPAYGDRPRAGWLSGAFAALALLAKGFALAFFIVHFVAITAVHFILARGRSERRGVLLNCARGALVFGAVAMLWALALNQKYHDPAVWFGFAGKYNLAAHGPISLPLGAPSTNAGIVPPRPGAVSIQEEPYYFYKRMPAWHPVSSAAGFKQQLKLMRDSSVRIVNFLGSFSAFWGAIAAAALLLCVAPLAELRTRVPLVCAVMTMAIYTGIYAALHSEARYLWPIQMLLLVLGGYFLTQLYRLPAMADWRRRAVLGLLFVVSFAWHPLDLLQLQAQAGRPLHVLSQELHAAGAAGARYASNEDYSGSVVLAYLLGGTFYGHPPPGTSPHPSTELLRQHGINYYIAWGDHPAPTDPAFRFIGEFKAEWRTLSLYAVR